MSFPSPWTFFPDVLGNRIDTELLGSHFYDEQELKGKPRCWEFKGLFICMISQGLIGYPPCWNFNFQKPWNIDEQGNSWQRRCWRGVWTWAWLRTSLSGLEASSWSQVKSFYRNKGCFSLFMGKVASLWWRLLGPTHGWQTLCHWSTPPAVFILSWYRSGSC